MDIYIAYSLLYLPQPALLAVGIGTLQITALWIFGKKLEEFPFSLSF